MTKEQEEAIERCNKLIETEHSNWIGITNQKAIETVLNMLKEKDKEIEHWKNGFERELEDNRKNTCELLKQDLIIREKDKQIDLMAKEIKEENYNFANKNIKEIKQYFERQAEQR